MDWFAAAIIFLGNALLIKYKSWWVFLVFLLGNSIYTYWWIIHEQRATAILTGAFIGQNLWGIYSWRKGLKNARTTEVHL